MGKHLKWGEAGEERGVGGSQPRDKLCISINYIYVDWDQLRQIEHVCPVFRKALSADTTVHPLVPRPGGRAQAWQQCFSGWFMRHLPQKPLEFLLKVQPCAHDRGSTGQNFWLCSLGI